MTPEELNRVGLHALVWDPELEARGRIHAIHHRLNASTMIDVEWDDGSASTVDQPGWLNLEIVTFPDRSDPDAVEQWLTTGGPDAQ